MSSRMATYAKKGLMNTRSPYKKIFGSAWVVWLSLTGLLLAADDPQALLDEAFKKTEDAKSVEQLGEVISLCLKAQKLKLTEEHAAYANRLLAWAYNKRGETQSEQAAKEAAQGPTTRSKQLDLAALTDFEKAVGYDPDRWKALHNRGVSLALQGEYVKALKDFDRVIELKPDYPNAWFNRGEIRLELKQYAEAIADYDETLKLTPDDLGAYTSRGHAYFRLKRFAEALADYAHVAEKSPKNAQSLADRGRAFEALGEWEKAAADFKQAIELDPQLAGAFEAAAWLMATCPEERYRNTELAIQAAERALDLATTKDYGKLDALAAAYANAGRFPDAQAKIQEAIAAAPASETAPLKERLALYKQDKPYRQDEEQTASDSSPDSTK